MIGSAIAREALKEGYTVLCIIRKDTKRVDSLPKSERLKLLHLNLDEYKTAGIHEKADILFHLAWNKTFGDGRDDIDAQMNNIQWTLDAVRLADILGCSVFVGAGSQAEYGIVSCPLTAATPANPESGYGIAKYTAGKLSRLLCSQLAIRHNWIRIVSTFGINDSPYYLIPHVIEELQKSGSVELTKCEQIWDYLYCDDAARAFLAVGKKGAADRVYTLGSGQPRKLSDYITALRNIVRPDGALKFGAKDYYPHQPMYLSANISMLTGDTGWKPEISFEQGIIKLLSMNRPPARLTRC